jgi:hypothetical protein
MLKLAQQAGQGRAGQGRAGQGRAGLTREELPDDVIPLAVDQVATLQQPAGTNVIQQRCMSYTISHGAFHTAMLMPVDVNDK